MTQFDAALTTWINGWSRHFAAIDTLMIWISALGIPALVLIVAVQWWFPPPARSKRHVLVASGLSFLLGLGFNQVVLLFVHRLRPYDVGISHLLVERSADFSFPSDHATASVAIATAFLLHGLKRQGLAFLGAAVLVAVSRVYIGTHFLGDVLGGAITGVAAAAVVRATYREGTRADRLITGLF